MRTRDRRGATVIVISAFCILTICISVFVLMTLLKMQWVVVNGDLVFRAAKIKLVRFIQLEIFCEFMIDGPTGIHIQPLQLRRAHI